VCIASALSFVSPYAMKKKKPLLCHLLREESRESFASIAEFTRKSDPFCPLCYMAPPSRRVNSRSIVVYSREFTCNSDPILLEIKRDVQWGRFWIFVQPSSGCIFPLFSRLKRKQEYTQKKYNERYGPPQPLTFFAVKKNSGPTGQGEKNPPNSTATQTQTVAVHIPRECVFTDFFFFSITENRAASWKIMQHHGKKTGIAEISRETGGRATSPIGMVTCT